MPKSKRQKMITIPDADWQDELQKSTSAQWALRFLGLPGVYDPDFEASVIHLAYNLGLLVRK